MGRRAGYARHDTDAAAEEIFGNDTSIARLPWPTYNEALARDDEVEIAVQILGKVKAKIMVSADADEAMLEQVALADPKVREQLVGKTVRKVIAVRGRLVNIVAN
mgnify:FL=1